MDGKTLYVLLTANAAAYRRELRGAGGDTREFGREVDRAGKQIDKTGREIDRLSGRVRLALDALALIGPALVPIAAVGVPAVTALASMLGVAVVAAGAAVVAFQGVGDALKAIEKAKLKPTAENLAEVHRLMSDLSPATREFVNQLDSMGDMLGGIQQAAAEGLFPGVTAGLRDLESMAPQATSLMFEFADSLGDVTQAQIDAFDSERGQKFLAFLESEARPTITTMAGIVGNLTGGMVELWQAFDPINDDAGAWMLKQAEAFDRWASTVDETEGFQEFMAYIRENGPQVADTLGSIADMTLQIIEAAAPMGGPVLQGIEFFADAVATIADSPIGPALIQGAAAATLLNRSLQITTGLMGKLGMQGTAAGGIRGQSERLFGGMQAGAQKTSTGIRTLTADLRTMSNEYRRAAVTQKQIMPSLFSGGMFGGGRSVTTGQGAGGVGPLGSMSRSMLSQTTAEAQRTKAALTGVAKAAGGASAGIAALAVVGTETGRGLGLTNTAMFALAGSMMGPVGAALGAGVGYMVDWRSSANEAAEATERFRSATENVSSITEYGNAFKALRRDAVAFTESVSGDSFWGHMGESLTPGGMANNLDILFGGIESSKMNQLAEAADMAEEKFFDLQLAGKLLAEDFGILENGAEITGEALDEGFRRALPAMQDLGISVDDLIQAVRDGSIIELQKRLAGWQMHADSAAGRTEAFAKTVTDLGREALSTADSAAAMGSALEALLSPALNAEEAYDAWRESIRTLKAELTKGAGFGGEGEAAVKNRQLTRDYTEDAMKRLKTLAGVATTTEEQMAQAVQDTRREFIASGIAAGMSEKAITDRANALGLTPSLVKTTFEAAGIDEVELRARNLRYAYEQLPKNVRTNVEANGIPKTAAGIEDLRRKYNLTPKQVKTLVALQDAAAKGQISNVKKLLADLERIVAQPEVKVGTGQAAGAVDYIKRLIQGIPDETVVVNVRRVHTRGGDQPVPAAANGGIWSGGVRRFASGGYGQNGRYYHREPMMVNGGANILWGEEETGWEAYISGKPSQRGRNVQILAAAAGRFGYSLAERRGSELVPTGGRRGASTVVVQQMPDKLTLEVDGQKFTAYVRAQAGDVTDKKMDARSRVQAANGRMNW